MTICLFIIVNIYTPVGTDGEFTVARNIKLTAVDLFSDLEIEVPYVDTSSFTKFDPDNNNKNFQQWKYCS